MAKIKACFLQFSQAVHFTKDTLKFTAKENSKVEGCKERTHSCIAGGNRRYSLFWKAI